MEEGVAMAVAMKQIIGILKKYRWLAGVVILVAAAGIGFCFYTREHKVGVLVNLNAGNISKIVIRSGNGGSVSYDAPEEVQKITAFLSEVKVHKELYYPNYSGWSYAFDIYYVQADTVTVYPGGYSGSIGHMKYRFSPADYEKLMEELN